MKVIRIDIKHYVLIVVLCMGITSLGQSKKGLIKEYKHAVEKVVSNRSLHNINDRLELYKSMDQVPRIIWGKASRKLILKKKIRINSSDLIMGLYDYDNDHVPDQFVLETLKGKILNQEFGFIYDLNKDSKIDYIIYYGGAMITEESPLVFYFYHWIDTNYDNKIDALAYCHIVYENETLPDPQKILWIMDKDKNGTPDFIDSLDMITGKTTALQPKNGVWNYTDLFGPKTVNANDENYFKLYTEYLKAINK